MPQPKVEANTEVLRNNKNNKNNNNKITKDSGNKKSTAHKSRFDNGEIELGALRVVCDDFVAVGKGY